eukprot:TRINITY_DN2278_c0_g4_i2.p1 TRINITY_DN2278_c0_g4~~TRINITY_DN2278_c0_g4_i2.p1  ORF type:complete len:297 (+),score=148.53 TRINITY_DN2278_c0_g4_i2:73-963(+)
MRGAGALRKKAAAQARELTRDEIFSIYQRVHTDLETEVDEMLTEGRKLISKGAPAQAVAGNLAEQYMMSLGMALQAHAAQHDTTLDKLETTAEQYAEDPEFKEVMQRVLDLSSRIEALIDEPVEQQELPAHITPELILQIAEENADRTYQHIRETNLKQKEEGLSDNDAAQLADTAIEASQTATLEAHDISIEQLAAATLRFSESQEFAQQLEAVQQKLQLRLLQLKAEDEGLDLETFMQRQMTAALLSGQIPPEMLASLANLSGESMAGPARRNDDENEAQEEEPEYMGNVNDVD